MGGRWLLKQTMALALGSAATLALAAPTDPATPDEILVEGQRLTPAQARERAVAYVQHTGITNGKESIARWIDPICPRVIGVAPHVAQQMISTLRTLAAQTGVPTTKPGCTPNIAINFVGNGDAFMRRISASDPSQLAKLSANEREALISGGAPVRWWYFTESRGRDGDRMNGMDPAFVTGAESGGATLPSNGESSTSMNYGASMVSTQMARALRGATVVIDTVKAEGATLDSVAAYTAMVAFAELQPRNTPFDGSILGLFGDPDAPRSLSKLDQTFLKELYALPLDRRARQQRGRLVRALRNEQSKF
jgi:hypothetical protein